MNITMKRGLAVASGLLALATLGTTPSQAATPAAARLGAASPTASWQGKTPLPAGGVHCLSSNDPICDNFFLEIESNGSVTVTISPKNVSDDWDLFVFDDDGGTVGSKQTAGGASEAMCFPVVAGGRWEVDAAPFLVLSGKGYNGTASWSSGGC